MKERTEREREREKSFVANSADRGRKRESEIELSDLLFLRLDFLRQKFAIRHLRRPWRSWRDFLHCRHHSHRPPYVFTRRRSARDRSLFQCHRRRIPFPFPARDRRICVVSSDRPSGDRRENKTSSSAALDRRTTSIGKFTRSSQSHMQ